MDKFEVKPKPELDRCMLNVRLTPASADKLEYNAEKNSLRRSELAAQMMEYALAKLPPATVAWLTARADKKKAEKKSQKKAKEVENGAVQGGTVSIAAQR